MRRALAVFMIVAFGLFYVVPWIGRTAGPMPDAATLPAPAQSVAIGDGLALNVRDLPGSGPPIVLVHGLPSNIGDWADLPDRLAARGHRVVVYDRVGYGHSSRAPEGVAAHTIDANAAQLGQLLDALGIERAALVGWSYGGGIVEEFAAEHPDRASHVVLLAAVGPSLRNEENDPIDALADSPVGPAVFDWLLDVPWLARGVLESATAEAFSGTAQPPGWVERTYAQLAMPGTLDAWLAEGRNGGWEALRPEAIRSPTLVLHGDQDRNVALEVGRDLAARVPGAELVVLEGGSHMLPATQADDLATRIHEWVSAR